MKARTGARRRRPVKGEEQKRQHIIVEAARIMAEEGVRDFQTAKRRAINRLNLPPDRNLPTNEEIEAALRQHLELFHGPELSQNLQQLRALALEAMRFLAPLHPRLVGGVLSGVVTADTEIQLHVQADAPEDVGFYLDRHHIPFEIGERRMRFGGDRLETVSTYRFTADGVSIELCVFDSRSVREPPLSPVDGKPMRRASAKEVEDLLGA